MAADCWLKPGIVRGLQKILVPLDFTDCSKIALPPALRFARNSKAQIILLHVLPARYFPDWQDDPLGGKWLVPNDWRTNAERLLAASAQAIASAGLPVEIDVRYGPTARQIAYVAGERNVGLIVMATHGYRGLIRTLFGSVANDVSGIAPCPVLIVRPESPESAPGQQGVLENPHLPAANLGLPQL